MFSNLRNKRQDHRLPQEGEPLQESPQQGPVEQPPPSSRETESRNGGTSSSGSGHSSRAPSLQKYSAVSERQARLAAAASTGIAVAASSSSHYSSFHTASATPSPSRSPPFFRSHGDGEEVLPVGSGLVEEDMSMGGVQQENGGLKAATDEGHMSIAASATPDGPLCQHRRSGVLMSEHVHPLRTAAFQSLSDASTAVLSPPLLGELQPPPPSPPPRPPSPPPPPPVAAAAAAASATSAATPAAGTAGAGAAAGTGGAASLSQRHELARFVPHLARSKVPSTETQARSSSGGDGGAGDEHPEHPAGGGHEKAGFGLKLQMPSIHAIHFPIPKLHFGGRCVRDPHENDPHHGEPGEGGMGVVPAAAVGGRGPGASHGSWNAAANAGGGRKSVSAVSSLGSVGGISSTSGGTRLSYKFTDRGSLVLKNSGLRIGQRGLREGAASALPSAGPNGSIVGSSLGGLSSGGTDGAGRRNSSICSLGGGHRPSLRRSESSRLNMIPDNLVYLCQLGVGASGTVYKAIHARTLKLFAVKEVPINDKGRRHQIGAELRMLLQNQKDHRRRVSHFADTILVEEAEEDDEEREGGGDDGETAAGGARGEGQVHQRYAQYPIVKALEAFKALEDDDKEDEDGDDEYAEINEEDEQDAQRVVAFYDAFTMKDESSVAIVMEYCGGGSLKDLMHAVGALDDLTLASIALDTLHGLRFIHRQRKLHRDVKPANMLLDDSGGVKLADFGLVRELSREAQGKTDDTDCGEGVGAAGEEDLAEEEDEDAMDGSRQEALLRAAAAAGEEEGGGGSFRKKKGRESHKAHTFVGTAVYMSPERLQGLPYSYPSDIWGVGLSLLSLALGRFPLMVPKKNLYWHLVQLLCAEHVSGAAKRQFDRQEGKVPCAEASTDTSNTPREPVDVFLTEHNRESLSPLFIDLVRKCLHKDPDQRPTVDDLLGHPFVAGAAASSGACSGVDLEDMGKLAASRRWSHSTSDGASGWTADSLDGRLPGSISPREMLRRQSNMSSLEEGGGGKAAEGWIKDSLASSKEGRDSMGSVSSVTSLGSAVSSSSSSGEGGEPQRRQSIHKSNSGTWSTVGGERRLSGGRGSGGGSGFNRRSMGGSDALSSGRRASMVDRLQEVHHIALLVCGFHHRLRRSLLSRFSIQEHSGRSLSSNHDNSNRSLGTSHVRGTLSSGENQHSARTLTSNGGTMGTEDDGDEGGEVDAPLEEIPLSFEAFTMLGMQLNLHPQVVSRTFQRAWERTLKGELSLSEQQQQQQQQPDMG